MHRNTYLLVLLLTILACLVVGVNLGKKIAKTPVAIQPTPVTLPVPTIQPTPKITLYTNSYCGVSVNYPETFTISESSNTGVSFTTKSGNEVALTCQKDIPRPALPTEQTESVTVASVSAKLYHDARPKDGTPIDIIIFRHPTNGMDVYLAGLGKDLTNFASTISIIK